MVTGSIPVRPTFELILDTMEKFTPEKEIAARQADATREQAVEKTPAPLEELELKELQKSEKPINEDGAGKKKIESLRPWNDYTVLVLEGLGEIRIFDENAERVEDFKEPLANNGIEINWPAIAPGKHSLVRDGRITYPDQDIEVSQLPFTVRYLARLYLGKGNRVPISNTPSKKYIGSQLQILEKGKYIIAVSKEGGLFAFVTENESGVRLAPRDWTRIDTKYKGKVPADLQENVETILSEFEGFKQINDTYTALITDVGINIIRKDNIKGAPVFSDTIPSVENNLITDPLNPAIYYCQSANPRSIVRLNMSQEPNNWTRTAVEFPKKYDSVQNLQLDPSGNFFLFYSKEDLVIVAKDGLEEVKRAPKLSHVNFDASGKMRAVDKDGRLVIYEPNFSEVAQKLDTQRAANNIIELTKIFGAQDAFKPRASQEIQAQDDAETPKNLLPLQIMYEEKLNEALAKITTREGIQQIRQGLNEIREILQKKLITPYEIKHILKGCEASIEIKEKEFAAKGAEVALVSVRATLAAGLSISSVSEARAVINAVRATEALLDEDLRREVREVAQELEQRSLELFRQRGGEIIKDVHGLIERTKIDLEGFTSKSQMDDWLEFRYPQLKSRLGSLAKDVPLEADEAYKAIIAARTELQTIASAFEDKFKREYAKVREKASERIGATVDILAQDVNGLVERLRAKGFTSRASAEQYLSSSEARKSLEIEIAGLASDNPDEAKELERGLKVRISNTLTEIERGALTQVAETGQQMVMFGEIAFPKWEAKVKEKVERKVDVTFEEDAKTHGPGVKAGDILGDISVSIRTSTGKVENVRLYEGWQDENEWRLGLLTYRGESIPPSYLTAKEFKDIRKEYGDWSQGEKSNLRKELQGKRDALKEVYSRRQKVGERTPDVDSVWQEEYKVKLQEYATFAAEHHIPLLRRIDHIKAEPDIEYTNGKGFVPEWEDHWVKDPQTDKYLEDMAKRLKMQLDLQEGMLNLKGHAGTGKDVLLKMFASKDYAHRTYFPVDCSKWTTEFELSQDVSLGVENGASVTVRDDSAVLHGIQTPGSVVYFNEFNAMPEQAQMFLHALMDEKRSLTLKTSSGRVVKAAKDVLLVCSMNPGYRGTTEPQSATRRRMVSMEIDYPPLTRKADAGDRNPNPPYDASEALRIARGVDSLADLTYEASLPRNEFVKMWDKYINGIDNGALEPTGTQKFDTDVILALVQFSHILRENFVKIFEKRRDARNALPVIHPISGSELRRCAYWLGKMKPEEKVTANPEEVARNLINDWFLSNIDIKEDQDKIRTAMSTWTSKKRVRA